MERKGKTPDSYRLSHFVAPLYVAPSTAPSNAKNPRQVFDLIGSIFLGIHSNQIQS